jgi:hypothetical protein
MPLNYRPNEQSQLEALLSSGLYKADPQAALGILTGVQGTAQARRDAGMAENQAMMAGLAEQLQQGASAGLKPAGLDALVASYQGLNPQLEKPKFQENISSMLEGLIPQGAGRSPLYTTMPGQGGAGGGGGGLGEDANAVAEQATLAAQKGLPLHEARMALMTALRASGSYSEEQLNSAYDLFGTSFQLALGHPYGGSVPLTMADRSPESWTAAARPGGGGGGLDSLTAPLGSLTDEQKLAQGYTTGGPFYPPWYKPGGGAG